MGTFEYRKGGHMSDKDSLYMTRADVAEMLQVSEKPVQRWQEHTGEKAEGWRGN